MKNYKYRVKEFLQQLPFHVFTEKRKELRKLLNVSEARYSQLLNIEKNDRTEWNGERLRIAANFLGCSIEELYSTQEEEIFSQEKNTALQAA